MYKDDVRAAKADRRCSSGDVQKGATQSVFEEADVASFRLCGPVKKRVSGSAPMRGQLRVRPRDDERYLLTMG
jgi:hypothetical protein